MKPILFGCIMLALAIILQTRRIGMSDWRFWAIGVLVWAAAMLGRAA